MDVVIGRVPPAGGPSDKTATGRGQIEARVLHLRAPRRRRRRGTQDEVPGLPQRRRGSADADPPGARVLVLLVPEGHRLPEDLASGDYRVFLRLVRK